MSSLIPPPPISVSSILSLSVKPSALYNITLSTILGATVYTTFISGVIAYKTLPRQQFGNLQSKLVPAHFTLTTTLSTGLLAAWIGLGNFAGKRWSDFRDAKVFNGWVLAGLVGLGAANLFVVVPWTSAIMFQRHRLERTEGKAYTDPDPSPEMKQLTSKFGVAHGASALLNLGVLAGALFHSAWVGTFGSV